MRIVFSARVEPDREKLVQKRMPNKEVPAFLKPYGVERVTMEASTSIAPLYQRLKREEYDVFVSHLRKTMNLAEALL
jgi:hypothetical protein